MEGKRDEQTGVPSGQVKSFGRSIEGDYCVKVTLHRKREVKTKGLRKLDN